MNSIHPGFISLRKISSDFIIEASYATSNNFTGEVVAGYLAQEAYLAADPARALLTVQQKASSLGLALKIFDAYRPKKAIAFFHNWAALEETRPEIKKLFYPKFSRQELFDLGYIAHQSSHSRGCAVDLTLCHSDSSQELDMGSCFDYFDELSQTDCSLISDDQKKNRELLKQLMEKEGFKNYSQEWWHFSFRPEPFPDQYFDFNVV